MNSSNNLSHNTDDYNNRSRSWYQWFQNKGLGPAVFWMVLGCFFSNCGDLAVKLVHYLPAMQITFMRVMLGTIILLPWACSKGRRQLHLTYPGWQLLRILVSFLAVWLWSLGASQTSMLAITSISFMCPIFVLPLSYLFLGEKSDCQRIIAIAVAFIGVLIIAQQEQQTVAAATANAATIAAAAATTATTAASSSNLVSSVLSSCGLHAGILILLLSALLFAFSDVLNKKLVASEGVYALLFYFCAGSTLLAAWPSMLVWQPLSCYECLVLFMLAASGVLLLFCCLKAVAAYQLSALSPYKYLEILFSVFWGIFLFGEQLHWMTILGCSLIIISTWFVSHRRLNTKN